MRIVAKVKRNENREVSKFTFLLYLKCKFMRIVEYPFL